MNDSVNAIIVSGILSSIFASIIMWIGIYFFKEGLKKYREYVYEGPDLSGVWNNEAIIRPDRKTEAEMILKQSGSKIYGDLTMRNINEGKSFTNKYKCEGQIFGNLLHLYGRSANRKFTGLFTCILHLDEGGRTLKGGSVGVDNFDIRLFNLENINWYRELS